MKEADPHPYGDEFTSVDQLLETVKARLEKGETLYGHAIIFIPKEGNMSERIGARVSANGDVTLGAHCEWV